MVRFDQSTSLQRGTSKDEIIITRALVGYVSRILAEFIVIYRHDSKYYLCVDISSDSGDRC